MNKGYINKVIYKNKGNSITLHAYRDDNGEVTKAITFGQKWFNGLSRYTFDISNNFDSFMDRFIARLNWFETHLKDDPFKGKPVEEENEKITLSMIVSPNIMAKVTHSKKNGKLDTKIYFYILDQSNTSHMFSRFYLNGIDFDAAIKEIGSFRNDIKTNNFTEYKHAANTEAENKGV